MLSGRTNGASYRPESHCQTTLSTLVSLLLLHSICFSLIAKQSRFSTCDSGSKPGVQNGSRLVQSNPSAYWSLGPTGHTSSKANPHELVTHFTQELESIWSSNDNQSLLKARAQDFVSNIESQSGWSVQVVRSGFSLLSRSRRPIPDTKGGIWPS